MTRRQQSNCFYRCQFHWVFWLFNYNIIYFLNLIPINSMSRRWAMNYFSYLLIDTVGLVIFKSIHISSSKFSVYFIRKNLLFLFYTSTFTKHPHQFIYSTHLFIKIFIILLIFIIHSLTAPLSHRPTTTITTQPPSPPSSKTKQKSNQPIHADQPTHTDQPTRKVRFNIRSTNTDQPTQRKINADQNTTISMPPRLHTYPNQLTTQLNLDQANPHKPRPTHTINSY